MTWQATIKPYKHQITHLGRVDVVIFAENFFFAVKLAQKEFLHFCSLAKGASKPTQPQVLTVLQWCFCRIGCSLCWGGTRGVFGAMPSASTRYSTAASSPARA